MNQEELEIYNFGYLNGMLNAVARINDKTNHGYDFVLEFYSLSATNSFKSMVKNIFSTVADNIELKQIDNHENYLINLLLKDWFYEFQKKNEVETYYLADSKKNFSLSDEEWRLEWVEEFVQLLIRTVNPKTVYKVKFYNFREHYANHHVDLIFKNEELFYRLHLSVSD